MRRRLGWVFVVGVVSLGAACTFDGKVPAGATVRCRSDAECPPGFVCSLIGTCRSASRADDDLAPTLDAVLSTTEARPLQPVTLTVTASEPLLTAPTVEARVSDTLRTLGLVEQTDDTRFVYTFTAGATDRDQRVNFTGSAEDRAGNRALRVALGSLRIDGSPPELLAASLQPSRVAPRRSTALTLRFGEAVQAGAGVTISDDRGAAAEVTFAGPANPVVRFEVTAAASDTSTQLHLVVHGVRDELGNEAAAFDGGTVVVDADPPQVGDPGLDGRSYSAQPSFNRIVVPVAVTGADSALVCLSRQCVVADAGTLVTFDVTAGLDGGPQPLLLRATDDVGNVSEVLETVVLDFEGPSVSSSTLRLTGPADCPRVVTQLGPRGTASVSLTADELLSDCELMAGANRFDVTLQGRTIEAVLVARDGGLVPSDGGLIATLTDTVGNQSRVSLDELRIDVDAPRPPLPNQVRYTRAPWGRRSVGGTPLFTLSADAGTFEPGVSLEVSTTGGLRVDTFQVDGVGALPTQTLSPLDRPALFFRQFDSACNVDTLVPRASGSVELVISLGGKVAGASAPNPHRLLSVPGALLPSLSTPFGTEFSAEAAALDGLYARTGAQGLHWFVERRAKLASAVLLEDRNRARDWAWLAEKDAVTSLVGFRERATSRWFLDEDTSSSLLPSMAVMARGRPLTLDRVLVRSFDGFSWSTPVVGSDLPRVDAWATTDSTLVAIARLDGGMRTYVYDAGAEAWVTSAQSASLPLLASATMTQVSGGVGLVGVTLLGGAPSDSAFVFAAADKNSEPTWNALEGTQSPSATDLSSAVIGLCGETLVAVRAPQAWMFTPKMGASQWQAVSGTAPALVSFSTQLPTCIGFDEGMAAYTFEANASTPQFARVDVDPPTRPSLDFSSAVLATDNDGGVIGVTANVTALATFEVNGAAVRLKPSAYPDDAGLPVAKLMTTNPATGRPFLVTQLSAGPFSAWNWNGASWTRAPNVGQLPSLVGAALAADATRRVMVLSTPTVTYAYDAGAWVPSGPAPTPQRASPALAFDASRNVMVLFGGVAAGRPLNDTWELSAGGWVQVRTATSPPPRLNPVMAYDRSSGTLVLQNGAGFFATTWVYDGTNWEELTSAAGRPLGSGPMAYEPTTQALLLPTSAGSYYLFAKGTSAQRFVPAVTALAIPASATVMGGAMTVIGQSSIDVSLYEQSSWVVAPRTLTPQQVGLFLQSGALLTSRARAVETDFLEATVLYQVP